MTVVVIEFHIVTLIAFVTIPFGILTQTSFLSERAIGYVASVGIKLMALAIVISIGANIFNAYTVSTDPTIYEEVGLLLSALPKARGAAPRAASCSSDGIIRSPASTVTAMNGKPVQTSITVSTV